MGTRKLVLFGALAALLAGCGGSAHKNTPQAAKPPSGFAGRALTSNELPGFTASPNTPAMGAAAWARDSGLPAGQQPAETRRLKRLGFVRGLRVDLSNGSTPGLSIVEQYRTAQAAQGEARYEAATFPSLNKGQGKETTFAVPGIPSAQGYGVVASGNQGGINISFSKGPYYYLVGQVLPGQGSARSHMATLITTAQKLYQRVSP